MSTPAATLATLVLTGAGVLTLAAGAPRAAEPQPAAPAAPRVDPFGDPLPDGAIARLGSVRLRHATMSDFYLLPDSTTAVTVGHDGVVRSWDLATGREVRAVSLRGARPEGLITVSNDGKVAAAWTQGKLTVWDAASGQEVKALPGPERDQAFLWLSPDGGTVVVGLRNPLSVLVIDWKTGQERRLPLPSTRVGIIDSSFHSVFSSDGKTLVAGSGEGLCVFETGTWREVHRLNCNARRAVVSDDGKTLAVLCQRPQGGAALDVRLFDMATGQETATVPVNGAAYFTLAIAPDGKTIALGRSDQSCLVDVPTGRVRARLSGQPNEMAFTPDGKTLVARSNSTNGLRLWDVATGTERLERPPELGPILAAALSPDGRLLATSGGTSQGVTLWDVAAGRPVRTLPLNVPGQYVRDVAFSPDGKTVSAAQYLGVVQFWDVATGQARPTLQIRDPGQPNFVYFIRLQVSADGRRVTTFERILGQPTQPEGTRLATWDSATGWSSGQQSLPYGLMAWAWAGDEAVVVPLPDGLTVFDGDRLLARHRITDGAPQAPVAAAPVGRLIVARRGADGFRPFPGAAVGVWDLDTGRPVATVNTGLFNHMALAGDDRTCVVVTAGDLHVWDLATGRERGKWSLPGAGATAVLVTPDGRRAVTTLSDGTGLIWDLAAFPTDPLVRTADAKDVAGWWADLASGDAKVAHAAAWRLADAPAGVVVPILATNLRPAATDAEAIRKAVAELDSATFAVREAATRRLQQMGGEIVPALRQALAATTSAEVRLRLEGLVERLSGPVTASDGLRRLRAVGVLERLGTAAARQVLAELADGPVHPQEARAAQAALGRLNRPAVMGISPR
jgi:WD40 repeat protein